MNEPAAREEMLALMLEKENKPVHVQHVCHLALQLFDQLISLHGLGPRERLLLEGASLLHDTGHAWDFDGVGHHKESARLIREHPWKNLAPADVEIVAQVARYHRKSIPDMSHDEFRALSETDRRIVQRLAGILRLADSLDRSHIQHITEVQVEVRPNQVVLRLPSNLPVAREVRAVTRKADLATAVFQRDVVLMVGDEVVRPQELPPLPPVE